MNKRPLIAFFCALFLFTIALCAVERLVFKRNQSFSPHLIYSTLPEMDEWKMNAFSPEKEAEIQQILNQKFFYLDKGKQAFVFESEDKKTVLKLYRLPSEYRPFAVARKNQQSLQKIEAAFQSLKCSFDQLREETGILWIHIHKGPSIKKEVTVVDQLGIEHRIALEKVTAVLQKKGTLLYPTLEAFLSQGKMEDAKRAIAHLVTLFYTQAKKGLENTDAILDKNYGLLPTGALIIDSGRLQRNETLCSQAQAHAKRMTHTLKDWLEKRSPPLLEHYETTVASLQ